MKMAGLVHIIDDDDSVRESLCFLLKSYGMIVESYASGIDFLACTDQVASGCVITDVRMPGMDGLQLLKSMRQAGVHLPVIVITGHGDIPLAVRAMKLGAHEFLEKPFHDEALIAAVRSALSQSRSVYSEAEALRVRGLISTLSDRERQTLEALVNGASNKAIALQLGISPRTVEVHRANLMNKMGAGGLSELVKMAIVAEREVIR